MYIVRGKAKVGSGISKSTWYRVLMRNQRPGPQHGQWTPVCRRGFLVVACSLQEAGELCYMIGQRYFGEPEWISSDPQYLEWLLANHLKLEPWTPIKSDIEEGISARRLEMSVNKFLRGWIPGEAAVNYSATTEMARSIIRDRLRVR